MSNSLTTLAPSSPARLSRVRPSPVRSCEDRPLSPSAAKLRLLKKLRCTLRYEKLAWSTGARLVAGVDEVGRGSLFGCVVAAAVILDPGYRVRGLRDSKLLPPERREVLAERIREHAVAWAVAAVDAARIDQINIYQASRVAMREAALRLAPAAEYLRTAAARHHPRRRAFRLHRRRVHPGQGGARPHHVRMGPHLPRIRTGLAQGLQHAQTPCRAPRVRPHAAAPPVVRAGVAESRAAGGLRLYAGS